MNEADRINYLADAKEQETLRAKFRQDIMALQDLMESVVANGLVQSKVDDCKLTHHFTPEHPKYGVRIYARELFIPAGMLVVGKIHRYPCLNFVMKGKIAVASEFGKTLIEAPAIFVSEAGIKRAGIAESDTIWATCHITECADEADLEIIEDEAIVKSFEELTAQDPIKSIS